MSSPIPSDPTVEWRDGVAYLSGEIDVANASEIVSALRDRVGTAGGGGLTIDMSAVEFLDSSGIRALVELQRMLLDASSRLTVRDPSSAVERVLDLAGVDDYLGVTKPR